MKKSKIYFPSKSASLDNPVRKFIQNPRKILSPYIMDGANVLDLGCGPGLFSFEMAKLVGKKGKVVAADIQQEMLDKLKNKISGLEIEKRIKIHKCGKRYIGLNEKFDFILVFYVAHEVENKEGLFKNLKRIMKPSAKILLSEPLFHVSKNSFEETLEVAEKTGFKIISRPWVNLSRSALLQKR